MKKTQDERVLERIKEVGYVDRDWALANYISRLAAIIGRLEAKRPTPLTHLEGKYLRGAKASNYYYVKPSRLQYAGNDMYELI